MNKEQLLELGFADNSYEDDGKTFTEFVLITDKFTIEITGVETVEMKLPDNYWFEIPNCKAIEDLKQLIRLFS